MVSEGQASIYNWSAYDNDQFSTNELLKNKFSYLFICNCIQLFINY